MRMIATGMSLAGCVTGCMTLTTEQKHANHLCNLRKQVAASCPLVSSEEDADLLECLDKRKLSSVEDSTYSAPFHPGTNEWLAFWLFLVASSYFLLTKQVNYFSSCRVKHEDKVSSSITSISNARAENDATAVNDMFCCSESSESSNRCSSGICTEYDVYSEISNFDGASYLHSLLSLEEEDSEWLSDSMTENPSSPVSHNCDSFTEISDVGTPSYWDSLLRLEQGEDSEWISDSKQELEYVRDGSPIPSYKGSWGNEVLPSVSTVSSFTGEQCGKSEDNGASYLHSLLSLEEEDSEWLSDSMTENPSSPVSHSCDSFTEISDVGTPSYWDSLLRLEQGEDSEWISDSKQELEYVWDGSPIPSYKGSWGNEVLPSVSTISSFTGEQCGKSEDNISMEHLLETADIEEFSADDEPLFWPFEGKFNWNPEESSFCTSPRRRLVSQQDLYLSKTCLNEDFDSNMDYHLEMEYFGLDQEFPIEILVGLKEFDGHEGLDSDFIGDVFMLEECLQ